MFVSYASWEAIVACKILLQGVGAIYIPELPDSEKFSFCDVWFPSRYHMQSLLNRAMDLSLQARSGALLNQRCAFFAKIRECVCIWYSTYWISPLLLPPRDHWKWSLDPSNTPPNTQGNFPWCMFSFLRYASNFFKNSFHKSITTVYVKTKVLLPNWPKCYYQPDAGTMPSLHGFGEQLTWSQHLSTKSHLHRGHHNFWMFIMTPVRDTKQQTYRKIYRTSYQIKQTHVNIYIYIYIYMKPARGHQTVFFGNDWCAITVEQI